MSLEGKKVVVIGATSGMGRATVEAAASEGARVVAAGRSPEKLSDVKASGGGGIEPAKVDVTDRGSVEDLFERVGGVDHLVITAADLSYAPVLEIDEADARRVFDSKLWGIFHAVRAAAPRMSQGGSVVLVSGVASEKPTPGASIVAAVNGAIPAFARALAVELAPIRVNVVSPGIVDTPSWGMMPDEEREGFFEQTAGALPVERVGEARDIAQAIVFLMNNGYTTGETLNVNGGALLV